MNAIILCILAFAVTYLAGRSSRGLGIIALLTVGYFFGIIRANLLSTAIYFIFDAALLGLYMSQPWASTAGSRGSRALRVWTLILIVWPALLLFMPFQPMLVALVGFRGSVLFLPMLLIGSHLNGVDLRRISLGLATLNLAALAFGGAEYFLGVPHFYPVSPVTAIIYNSVDVAGGFYRIPAIFANAHLYGGTMAASIPYLVGGWDKSTTRWGRALALLGIGAALLGVLMSATRLYFITGAVMVMAALWNRRMKIGRRILFGVILVGVAALAVSNQRFQRFKSLSDTESVEERIAGSVNRGFFEILLEYPMGNGLGGGGTSIPEFLAGQVRNPIGMENEYSRILSEQGIIGLLLWACFIVWYLTRFKTVFASGAWATSRRLVWSWCAFGLLTGVIGTGMLTAIPATAMLLLGLGWTAVQMAPETANDDVARLRPAAMPPRRYSPVSSQGLALPHPEH